METDPRKSESLPVGVALEGPAMELAQLDRSHVGGNEGAGQLHRRGRVLQERPSRRTLNKIIIMDEI
jgi:hypothetical protein